jgi:hypothetical protein
MIEPNHNFENEIQDQYDYRNYEFRKLLDSLLTKHKVISQKEYDVTMWIGCNLPTSSLLRDCLLQDLTRENARLNHIDRFLSSDQKKLEL